MSFNSKPNDGVNKPEKKYDDKKPPSKSDELSWKVKQQTHNNLPNKK